MVDVTLVTCLFEKLKSKNLMVVFAESLTAGLISSELSKLPGSSQVLWGGFVVYSTLAKKRLLHVPASIIKQYGVVSGECALSMAKGALKVAFNTKSTSNPICSLAVTGLAGPPSRFDEKNVGTVYIAVARILNPYTCNVSQNIDIEFCSSVKLFHFQGDRNSVREQTLNNGVEMLIKII